MIWLSNTLTFLLKKIKSLFLNLSIKNESLERLFFSEKKIFLSLGILISSCICGAIFQLQSLSLNLQGSLVKIYLLFQVYIF